MKIAQKWSMYKAFISYKYKYVYFHFCIIPGGGVSWILSFFLVKSSSTGFFKLVVSSKGLFLVFFESIEESIGDGLLKNERH